MLRYSLKNKAFSLLELIIAVAILSVGITVVLQALSFSTRATGLSCDIISAVLLGKDKLQELEFKKEKQNLTDLGPQEGNLTKFYWNYALNPDPALNLSILDFNITWQRLNRKENLSLNTYLRE